VLVLVFTTVPRLHLHFDGIPLQIAQTASSFDSNGYNKRIICLREFNLTRTACVRSDNLALCQEGRLLQCHVLDTSLSASHDDLM
jgi:hypothetical protein